METIQIERINRIPKLNWSANTAAQVEEVFKVEQSIMQRSQEVYLLRDSTGRPLMIVGLLQQSLITGWQIWTMVCEGNLTKTVRTLRKMLHILVGQLGHVMISVDKAFKPGLRFAEFLGFRFGSEVDSIDGKTYCFYEMDRAWLTQ